MSFRSETKFRLSYGDHYLLKSNLLSLGMKQLYPSRFINSEYFDTDKLQMFLDSEEGVLPRKKIRVRWYHEKKEKKLETKISSVEGRFKTREIIDEEKFSFLQKYGYLDKTYGNCLPNFYVTYDREYSKIKDVRISIDKNIVYTNFLTKKSYFDNKSIVELKTSIDKNLDELVEMFPFQKIRFSKYCFAVESLN